MSLKRCSWAERSELERHYHDTEWGVVQHNDNILFEMLILESLQAGLSWSTIIAKRENFRAAFDNFNPKKIIHYDEHKIAQLMQNKGIIRHRKKLEALIKNAQAFLNIQQQYGSFDRYIWAFCDNKPQINHWHNISQVPAITPLSIQLSRSLKKAGFSFLGPTSVYAFMQAIGMVNDHIIGCPCHPNNQTA